MTEFVAVLHVSVCGALALVLAGSALHKLTDVAGFARILSQYQMLPGWAIQATARSIPVFELVAAGMLLAAPTRPLGGALAAGLLAIYSSAIALQLRRGRTEIDCGCGGFGADQGIRPSLLGRNAALMAAALWALQPVSVATFGPAVLALSAVAGLVLVLLYAAADQLLANGARFRVSDA